MTLNLQMPQQQQRDDLKPRITVFGVGGAGGNAVNNMIERQLEGCEFVVANTDAQALQQSKATARVQMGVKVTEGLGAGARPAVGSAAAEESIEEIVDHLAGSHMCFITAGMGGGTGTGATPIIAQAARELGVLTVGVVTKPFQFEGSKRMRQAEEGIEALQKVVDTLIIIPNQNLFRIANEKTTCADAFGMADDVLYQGVKGVTDLMVRPGLINLDFADVRAVMDEMGKAMMGTGEAEGEDRAMQAAEKAIANPLLDEISLNGAKGVLINIIGGHDLTIYELDEAANVIREKVDQDANIIVGSTLDEEMVGKMRVSVVATGIDTSAKGDEAPVQRRRMAEPLPAGEPQQPVAQEPAPQPEPEDAHSDFFGEWRPRAAEPQQAAIPDEMPEPVSRAQPEPSEPQAPRRAGEPSADALARLQRAVSKSPEQQGQQRPQAPRAGMRRPQPQAEGGEERSRFGINSLINRISGQHQQEPTAPERPQRPAAAGPAPARRAAAPQPTQYEEDEDATAEQDRIEIPAFLRRQAN